MGRTTIAVTERGETINNVNVKDDAEFVAEILNLNKFDTDHIYTADEIRKFGFQYAFTELTDDEARALGAKAYIKRVEDNDVSL